MLNDHARGHPPKSDINIGTGLSIALQANQSFIPNPEPTNPSFQIRSQPKVSKVIPGNERLAPGPYSRQLNGIPAITASSRPGNGTRECLCSDHAAFEARQAMWQTF
mgnify:FL=1